MGRLTRDTEIRYSQATEPMAIVKFAIAVPRRFKREGQPDVDFINCTAFGKTGEFINKFFVKGSMLAVEGRIQTSSWDDKETGQKRYGTDILVEQAYFTGEKREDSPQSGFVPMIDTDDDDLPF
jgi:single-strand DNA-binding protein